MGHEDKGNFAGKHNNIKINPDAEAILKKLAVDGNITCAGAHKAAASLNLDPEAIGIQIDLFEYKISQCQVGLFGYPETGKKLDKNYILNPAVDEALDAVTIQGRVSCYNCWQIAKKLKIKRLDMGSACEKKGLKIKPCQLGTF